MNLNIFESPNKNILQEPLAIRMRPKSINDFLGQEEILGPNKLLRRAIETDKLFSSIILWGPPGTGKTTLANIIANSTKSYFQIISAVISGIPEIRTLIAKAEQQKLLNKRTIVLVDEIHRFNKTQQDALLPHVEAGTITLIGATTENPYFEVVPALVSRSRIFKLKNLDQKQIIFLLNKALKNKINGYGNKNIEITQEALEHLANISGGDARCALNALELAVESTIPDNNNLIKIDLEIAEQAIQKRSIKFDKSGDQYYDTISAFIKSIRGSDPDAALYWLAKMIYAGQDPKFIMRRLLILASEDIGLADPLAIIVTSSCAKALEWCGLPEAQYHLAQATVYLATAIKSNSLTGYFNALKLVEQEGNTDIPKHLKNNSKEYKYPHDYENGWIEQNYLPENLVKNKFYEPKEQGYEKKIIERFKLLKNK